MDGIKSLLLDLLLKDFDLIIQLGIWVFRAETVARLQSFLLIKFSEPINGKLDRVSWPIQNQIINQWLNERVNLTVYVILDL